MRSPLALAQPSLNSSEVGGKLHPLWVRRVRAPPTWGIGEAVRWTGFPA
ncbi:MULTISPECIES: hypothetical protein [unclassified Tolypothrix]|nr:MULTISPECIES: hypothetical protein [unclassified Tolypothrix]MBE9087483.1 hypothetical protein [Tolypothrix sp. LEGE 11397]UYD29726.1 hypothetical protein HGR01_17910 [Tolypothrix sp. PCC 7712]UYD34357.1 hypothetical protein HG267_00370 [Tolypothrix sp. PCC 7601]